MITVEVHSHRVITSADIGRYKIELELTQEDEVRMRNSVTLIDLVDWFGETKVREYLGMGN
jgi:hypothetical protein